MLGEGIQPPNLAINVVGSDKKVTANVTIDGRTCGEQSGATYHLEHGGNLKVC